MATTSTGHRFHRNRTTVAASTSRVMVAWLTSVSTAVVAVVRPVICSCHHPLCSTNCQIRVDWVGCEFLKLLPAPAVLTG